MRPTDRFTAPQARKFSGVGGAVRIRFASKFGCFGVSELNFPASCEAAPAVEA